MKKVTLFLASVMMVSGVAFAEGKSCCKKNGAKCAKEGSSCCKDKDKKKECNHKEGKEEAKKETSEKK